MENTQSKQQKENEIKKWGYFKDFLGQLQAFQHLYHGGVGRRRERQGIESILVKIIMENFPGERNTCKSPESTEDPKQYESKESHDN